MRKFIFTVLAVAVFFTGLGGLIAKVGAKFKSDERALAIIALARQAIGGDAAIKNVRGLTIVGNTEQTFTVDGAARTEQGNLEINLQMPNQFSKMLRIGKETGAATGGEIRQENHIVIISKDDGNASFNRNETDGKTNVYVIKKGDADKAPDKESGDLPADAKRRIIINKNVVGDTSHPRQNELFRTTFALLLSAPEGLDVNYTYAGAENIDGNACDVVLAETGGSSYKLYIDQSSHLPVMMSYMAEMPEIFKFKKDEAENTGDSSLNESKDNQVKVFKRVINAPEATAEFQVKFSDYRNVGGVQLPYKWTQTVGGKPDQTVNIISYDINPANIADKFKDQKIMVRTKHIQ